MFSVTFSIVTPSVVILNIAIASVMGPKPLTLSYALEWIII
jgi:hypothetical protein